MRPEGSEDVVDEVTERHARIRRGRSETEAEVSSKGDTQSGGDGSDRVWNVMANRLLKEPDRCLWG